MAIEAKNTDYKTELKKAEATIQIANTEKENLQAELQKIKAQLIETQKQTAHFVDELRFVLGIAVQARPEIEQLKIMANELYRIDK